MMRQMISRMKWTSSGAMSTCNVSASCSSVGNGGRESSPLSRCVPSVSDIYLVFFMIVLMVALKGYVFNCYVPCGLQHFACCSLVKHVYGSLLWLKAISSICAESPARCPKVQSSML